MSNLITPCVYDIYHGTSLNSSNFKGDQALFAEAMVAGWPWVIHKATQGATFQDPLVVGRMTYAARAGSMIGLYHFMTAESVASQVANFMHVVGQVRMMVAPALVVLMLDNEPGPGNTSPGMAIATATTDSRASDFVDAVRAVVGKPPLVYGNRYNFFSKSTVGSLVSCKLVLAEYGSNPIAPAPWQNFPSLTTPLHQYYADGVGPNPVNIPGIGLVDQSTFAGSLADLPAFHASLAI